MRQLQHFMQMIIYKPHHAVSSYKAEALNQQFYSVFTKKDNNTPIISSLQYPNMPEVIFTEYSYHCGMGSTSETFNQWYRNGTMKSSQMGETRVQYDNYSVSAILNNLEWSLLPKHWQYSRLTLFFKFLHYQDPASHLVCYQNTTLFALHIDSLHVAHSPSTLRLTIHIYNKLPKEFLFQDNYLFTR